MKQKRRFHPVYPVLALLIIMATGEHRPLAAEKDCGCGYEKLQNRIKGKWKGDRKLSLRMNKLGLAKHRKKDYCGAIATWCRAAEADPSFWKPFFNIACAHSLMGNPELSIKFIKRSFASDTVSALRSVISDSDLKPIRNHPGYKKVLREYGGRECIETFLKLDSSLKKGDYRLFRSLIHKGEGLKIQQKKFTFETFTRDEFNKIRREMYQGGPLSIGGVEGNGDSLSASVTTNYRQDPPGSPMRCESWTDNFFTLKKTGEKWYLRSVHSEGNGGC